MTQHEPPAEATPPARPRVEVVQETHEKLDVLELPRTPRDEKLARERALYGGAHEVELRERRFRPRHAASLRDVRAAVDQLQVARRPLPEPQAPAPAAEPPRPPEPEADLTPAQRKALRAAVAGTIVAVRTLYRTDAGHAVEATVEKDGRRTTAEYVLRDDGVVTFDDLARRIDALPIPDLDTPAAVPEAPRAPAPPEAPSEPPAAPARRRFGLGRGKRADEEPAEAPGEATPSEAPADKPKRRLGLGRKQTTAEPDAEAAADGTAPPKKRRFGRRG